jgi:ABC-2 type transport system ATP-binding protein
VKGTLVQRSPVISLENVRKSYKGGFELGPVDLQVEPGCIVAVLGPNGGGKSTLFGMLMGLIHPSSGEVRLFGLSYPKNEVAIKQRIGYVPERAVGHDRMRVRDLAEFVSYWYPTWDQRTYDDLVSRSGIDPYKRFGKLSKGMQRRLSFALALSVGPELLLLDEPTEGVDPFARKEMLEVLWRFVRDGRRGEGNGAERTVLFATQVVEEARRVADHVLLLADGHFHGFHEKDALVKGWKTFWVDAEPEGHIPGVVEIESGSPTRIVTDSPHETAEALSSENIRIVRSGRVDLEEILSHLIRRNRAGQRV